MYRGAFPAQLRHVRTVLPPMQEMWPGSRLKREKFVVDIVSDVVDDGMWWGGR